MRSSTVAVIALSTVLVSAPPAVAADHGAPAEADRAATLQGEQHYELIGRNVIGQNGKTVGEIDNVLVDGKGQATHVVLGHGGWLEMGEKSVALGLDKLQVTRDDIRVTLSDEQLAALPAYEGAQGRTAGQSAATPDERGAPVPEDGAVAGPSGATLDATPGVMKEPVNPRPAD